MLQGRSMMAVAVLLALLAGCSSLGPESAPPPSVDGAETLARQGDNAGAARLYEALAEQNASADRAAFQLRAARAWVAARQPDEAARVLLAAQGGLTPVQTTEAQLLGVEVALARGQAQQAWQELAAFPAPTTAPEASQYWDLKRRAALATGRFVEAVRAHTAQERWLGTPEQLRASRAELMGELRDATEHGAKIDARTAPDALTRGWLELASLAADVARNPNGATSAVEAWRARYPGHPADDVVRTELLGVHVTPQAPTPHVALLLPLGGRQSSAAISVRDGFLTAYYVNAASGRPPVRIYDTSVMSVAQAVAQAAQEGAEFIVGPLTREEVIAASELTGSRPPILALNFLPTERPAPNAFYQFALSPEDEARQAARRALADGNRRGIALVPEGDWGTRVLSAFKDELTMGGGTLIETASYDASRTDYAPAIMQILHISDSNARHKRLESVLGTKLEFQPRRRGDIAFIFAAGEAASERQLRPQLRFYFAGDVPTYATSNAFEPDPNANQDMEGLMFPDMPWMLGGGLADSVHNAARDAWPNGGPRRNRLFAFGFDAYRLAGALRAANGGAISVEGLTGRLSLDTERRVHRELEWAQLQQGQPHALPPRPQS
ncbi:MAG TPA: penicillin-binding protein activator [Steroidobacteraceae bacterium]|nr:penicillin-binding protein activator [Steroidobacteraceae bacterium]